MYDRILATMKKKGIKYIADLARKSGVTEGSIRMIKYGNRPSAERLLKIANTLGVSVNYLVTGEEEQESSVGTELSDKREMAISLLEGLSEEDYKVAIDYLTYLKIRSSNRT